MNNKLIIRQATIQDLTKIVPIFDCYREYFQQQRHPTKVESFLFENLNT